MSCPRHLISATSSDFWSWWSRTAPDYDPRYKDAYPSGPPGKLGGSSSGGRKQPPPKKAIVYVWGE